MASGLEHPGKGKAMENSSSVLGPCQYLREQNGGTSERVSRYGISDAEQAVFSQVSSSKERTLSLGNRIGRKKRKQAPTWFLWYSTGLFLGTRPETSPYVDLIGEPSCGVATWKNTPLLLYYHYLPHPHHF